MKEKIENAITALEEYVKNMEIESEFDEGLNFGFTRAIAIIKAHVYDEEDN